MQYIFKTSDVIICLGSHLVLYQWGKTNKKHQIKHETNNHCSSPPDHPKSI